MWRQATEFRPATDHDDDTPAPITSARLEALSDGVLAIAATLLIFLVRGPAPSETVGHWVTHSWIQFATYVVSFFTIGITWVNHHGLFHVVRRVDRPLLFLNLGLLLTFGFLPLATSVVGTRSGDPDASVFYSAVLFLGASWFVLMWWHLRRNPHLLTPAARGRTGASLRRSATGPVCYLVAIGIALLSSRSALALDALVAAMFVWPPRHLRVTPDRRAGAEPD